GRLARDQGADPRARRRPDVGRAVRGDRPGAASFTGRRAYSTGIVAISCVLTFFLALLLIQAEGGQSATSTGARIAGLFSPFTILDGVRVWLGGSAQTGLVADPGRYGPLYGVLAVVVLAACLGGLAARYRKASQS
ncbi:MAG TPA: hypothetical protein VK594_04095, partial [Streptosporangiaceae bacterium]|nr:hypothetical protein [Streptosporangiaceae bacterium]